MDVNHVCIRLKHLRGGRITKLGLGTKLQYRGSNGRNAPIQMNNLLVPNSDTQESKSHCVQGKSHLTYVCQDPKLLTIGFYIIEQGCQTRFH